MWCAEFVGVQQQKDSTGNAYDGKHGVGVNWRCEVAESSGSADIVIESGLQAVGVCVGDCVARIWSTCVSLIGDSLMCGNVEGGIGWNEFVLGKRYTCIIRLTENRVSKG